MESDYRRLRDASQLQCERFQVTINSPIRCPNGESTVETMQRLRELPVRVVHGSHEPSFGRPRLIKIADAYLDRHDT